MRVKRETFLADYREVRALAPDPPPLLAMNSVDEDINFGAERGGKSESGFPANRKSIQN